MLTNSVKWLVIVVITTTFEFFLTADLTYIRVLPKSTRAKKNLSKLSQND